jgi:hydrogenase assembly chaperone HypC/HupF
MCLGEVCQVQDLSTPGQALVSHGAVRRSVSLLAMSAPLCPGDWVVVHSGFVLERLAEDEAHAALALRAGSDPDRPDDLFSHPAEKLP